MRKPDFTAKIEHLERLNNSVYGNPRYEVTFNNDRVAKTMSDAAFAYAINNPEYRGLVGVELTRAGTIRHLWPMGGQ